MGDMIDRDAVLALVAAHIKDARRTYAGIHQAQEPLAFVESLLLPEIAALPAEPAEDVRAGALRPDEMLPEAIRLIRIEASRDYPNDTVIGLRHIASLLENLLEPKP